MQAYRLPYLMNFDHLFIKETFFFLIGEGGSAPLPKVPARRPKYHRVDGTDDPLPSGKAFFFLIVKCLTHLRS